MKKNKLLTPILGVATISTIIAPLTSCSQDTTITPKVVTGDGIKVEVVQAKLNETLIFSFEYSDGYELDAWNSYVKVGGEIIRNTDLYYIDYEENLVYIKATAITSKDVEICIMAEETLSSISYSGDYKKSYEEGDSFDTTNLVITGNTVLGNQVNIDLAKCTFSPSLDEALTADTTVITVSYKGFSVDVPINVAEAPVEVITGLKFELDASGTEYNCKWDSSTTLPKRGTLPTTYNGKPVTGIIDEGFKSNLTLQTIIIPEGYTYIGEYAFAGCTNLQKVQLPSTLLEIADGAFAMSTRNTPTDVTLLSNNLTTVEIPSDSKIQVIGGRAFEGTNITSIAIPKGTITIGSYAFYGCPYLESVDFTNATSLQVINELAFAECASLTTVTKLENTVLKTLKDYAFGFDANLSGTITLPKTIYAIEAGAFSLEEVETTEITETPLIIKFADDCNLRYLGNAVWSNRANLTQITLPSKLHNIGANDFVNCTSLTSITIPYSVCRIGWCHNQGNCRLGNRGILAGCSNLQSIDFEDENSTWGSSGSSGVPTSELETIQASNPLLIDFVSEGFNKDFVDAGTVNNVPYNIQVTGDSECLIGLSSIVPYDVSTVTIPSTITVNGNTYNVKGLHVWGFEYEYSNNVTKLILPDGMEYLDCEAIRPIDDSETEYPLQQIILPDSLKYIGKSAIGRKDSGGSLAINTIGIANSTTSKSIMPSSLEFIDDYAFYPAAESSADSFSQINEIQLPAGNIYVGTYAFYSFNYVVDTDGSGEDKDWIIGSTGEWWRTEYWQSKCPAVYTNIYIEEFQWIDDEGTKDYDSVAECLPQQCQYYYLKVN